MAEANTVTVCSKLPFGFWAEAKGGKVKFHINGAKGIDVTGEAVLTPGYGLTPNVPKADFDAWKAEAVDFAPLLNGSIFASEPNKAVDEAKEMDGEVSSGFEQKSPEELGVEVAKDS
jgi:hypothetical protein